MIGSVKKLNAKLNDRTNEQFFLKLNPRLKKIKALVLDCDGILTDTRIYYSGNGKWSRTFSIRDGFGIRKLQEAGLIVSVITNSKSEDITERMKVLKIEKFYDGVTDKTKAWDDFLQTHNLQDDEVAYMGDDEPDLPLLERAGLAATVSDAMPVAIRAAQYVAKSPAGLGAVREVCELIISAKNVSSKKSAKTSFKKTSKKSVKRIMRAVK